ncbi:MAG: hypothetical protein R2685_15505 [Candidatus Nitrosocosmicus sp.]|nr:hypothetical protein [Candidatus Nitrosocosmicus sp.]
MTLLNPIKLKLKIVPEEGVKDKIPILFMIYKIFHNIQLFVEIEKHFSVIWYFKNMLNIENINENDGGVKLSMNYISVMIINK